MATSYERERRHPFDGATVVYKWVLGAGETGDAVCHPTHADVLWHAEGTFDGASVAIEGTPAPSEAPPASGFEPLHTPGEAVLTLSDASGSRMKQSLSAPYWTRPRVVGGTGNTALTIRRQGVR